MAIANQTQPQVFANQFQFHNQQVRPTYGPLTLTRLPRVAVLIDAENAPPGIINGLFRIVAQYGVAHIRRAYGDWTSHFQTGWRKVLQTYAITPVQQFPYIKNKSVTDMTMIIDAMDLLHSHMLDAFCLVSSDSDFARLAIRIQEEGLAVFGFGEKDKAIAAHMQACNRFYIWQGGADFQEYAQYCQEGVQLLKHIRDAFTQVKQADGWANMNKLDNKLRKIDPDFTPRKHGYEKLRELLQEVAEFEVMSRNGSGLFVRDKKIGQNGTGP